MLEPNAWRWESSAIEMKGRVLNFSYGSNMLLERIRARVASAEPIGSAMLAEHELRWHKVGRDGSAKCDIVACRREGAVVHGVLYALDPAEQASLDRAEGLGDGYELKPVLVRLASAGGSPVELAALAYGATRIDPLLLPFGWYRDLVVAGARQHRLPPAYVAGLASVRTLVDPDASRHANSLALLAGIASAGTKKGFRES
jgi:gamma-glutamylcyclotransferase